MAAVTPVTLPSGLWLDGVHHRQVSLRAPTANDDAALLETRDALLPSQRVTVLLGRCVVTPAGGERIAGALTVGDREALLLHLLRLAAGDRLEGVLRCPRSECGAPMELALDVNNLLLPPYPHARAHYEIDVTDDRGVLHVRFHLPTGAEQDEAAALARVSADDAAALLLSRCVEGSSREGRERPPDELPEPARRAVSAAAAELDPQAELELDVACAACGHGFPLLFDTAAFLLRQLDTRGQRLLRDVHTLARHYHWSERDILDLPAGRRARYLELIADGATRGAW